MDLNLYLGLPLARPSRSLDLGSDLSLGSLPWSPASPTVDSIGVPSPMPGAAEPSESHPPYSPSHAEYTPDLPAFLPRDGGGTPEYTPFFPSLERYEQPFSPISPAGHELHEPDAAYSPPSVQALTAAQEPDEPSVRQDADAQPLYDPASPPTFSEALPYMPAYFNPSAGLLDREAANFSFYPPVPPHPTTDEYLYREHGPSSRPEPLPSADSFFGRLLDSSHHWPNRRFRSSSRANMSFSFGSPSQPNPEQPVNDVLSSQRPPECNGKHKVTAENNPKEASDNDSEEKGRNAANFECFICFDMAAEPVVTSCGHLFCWPCLYQWLHVHSLHKECPVCKGVIYESNITPLYGRGSSQPSDEKKNENDGESTLKIPPRPRGNRSESFRQQFWHVSRRLGEGIAASWRRLLDQHANSRYEPYADPSLQELYENVHRRALIRLRARRLQREINPESGSVTGELGPPMNNLPSPIRNNTDPVFRDGVDFWQQFNVHDVGTDRITASSFGRVVGRPARSDRTGASTSAIVPLNTEPPTSGPQVEAPLAADQASVSSTMAVIQEDVATSDAPAEPNSVGSSPINRRRGRSSTSDSVDGGTFHPCKRRRFN